MRKFVLLLMVLAASVEDGRLFAQQGPRDTRGSKDMEGLLVPYEPRKEGSFEPVLATQMLYALGRDSAITSSVLYRIDNFGNAPQAHEIGATGADLTDLAIDPTSGRYFAVSFDGSLYELNPVSGLASEVGFTGRFDLNALEFDAAGQAWAWGTAGGLYRINKQVGNATLISNTGFSSGGDLAFDGNGLLYGTTDSNLIRINPGGGLGTVVGFLGFNGAFGLEVAADGTMYAGRGSQFSNLAELYRVNKSSGATTFVGEIAGSNALGLVGLSFTAAGTTPGACVPNSTTLCLNGGRFKVQATYNTGGQGGGAQVVKLTDETGYLWFFTPSNVEAVIKVLNACGVNQRYWVFSAGLTNVGVEITVTDTKNGSVKRYSNPIDRTYVTNTDTGAFATCP